MSIQLLVDDALLNRHVLAAVAVVRVSGRRLLATSFPQTVGFPEDVDALLTAFADVLGARERSLEVGGIAYNVECADERSLYAVDPARGGGLIAVRTHTALVIATYLAAHEPSVAIELVDEFASYLRATRR